MTGLDVTGHAASRTRPRVLGGLLGGASARFLVIRVTGVLLAVLALGHFAVTHIATDVAATGSAFIAARWSSALWVVWDGLLLGCALLHGAAALAAVVRDYRADRPGQRRWLAGLAGMSCTLFLVGLAALLFASLGRS